LDRQTGLIKGYALIEYEDCNQAKKAIDELNGQSMFGNKLDIGWAFKKNPADS
jgi:RNA-binding protein 8A